MCRIRIGALITLTGDFTLTDAPQLVALPGLRRLQTVGGDLRIYDATVQSAIQSSRLQMLSSVQLIFANKLPVIPARPARLLLISGLFACCMPSEEKRPAWNCTPFANGR